MASKSEKPLKTIVKPRFFKDAPLFERYVFLFKTIKIYLKNTVDNDIRSGNDFFSILSRFGTSWRPFWTSWGLLGVPWGLLGAFWASLGSPLACSWTLFGVLRVSFWRSWALFGGFNTALGRSWLVFLLKITPKELRRAILGDTDLIFS